MMSRKKSNRNGKGFVLGALVGGLLGGMTALLFTPKSGEKMRKEIAKKYYKASDKAHDLVDDAYECSSKLIYKVKGMTEDAKETASRMFKRKD